MIKLDGVEMNEEMVVDARYKSCPGPLISLLRAVRRSKPGTIIKLLTTDSRAIDDVRRWAAKTGHKFLEYEKIDDYYEIRVEV